jgi:transcriptional regulator with XRE-family HTH domain
MASALQRLFGPHLRSLRELRGLTQEELAARAGLHVTHISLLEHGKRSARIETLERLGKALGIQPRELLPSIKMPRRSDKRDK